MLVFEDFKSTEKKIVIVIHDGRGWFDPMSEAKGDVFDLATHLGASGFPEALQQVADLVVDLDQQHTPECRQIDVFACVAGLVHDGRVS